MMRRGSTESQERVMSHVYDDDAHIDERRDVVFCWLRNEKTGDRVRVEATRKFILDNWKKEWSDKRGLIAEFQRRKADYLERASKAPESGGAFKVYVMR
jgi:hypothetical protein